MVRNTCEGRHPFWRADVGSSAGKQLMDESYVRSLAHCSHHTLELQMLCQYGGHARCACLCCIPKWPRCRSTQFDVSRTNPDGNLLHHEGSSDEHVGCLYASKCCSRSVAGHAQLVGGREDPLDTWLALKLLCLSLSVVRCRMATRRTCSLSLRML